VLPPSGRSCQWFFLSKRPCLNRWRHCWKKLFKPPKRKLDKLLGGLAPCLSVENHLADRHLARKALKKTCRPNDEVIAVLTEHDANQALHQPNIVSTKHCVDQTLCWRNNVSTKILCQTLCGPNIMSANNCVDQTLCQPIIVLTKHCVVQTCVVQTLNIMSNNNCVDQTLCQLMIVSTKHCVGQ
jgi:hypothetical protein